jgi:hypothetical protein
LKLSKLSCNLIFKYEVAKLGSKGIPYLERVGEGGERQREREIGRYREKERELIIKITGNVVLPSCHINRDGYFDSLDG